MYKLPEQIKTAAIQTLMWAAHPKHSFEEVLWLIKALEGLEKIEEVKDKKPKV